MQLETERLIFRPYTLEDLPELIEMRADPRVHMYLGGIERQNAAEVTKRMDFYFDCYEKFGFGSCAIIWKENGEHIGSCGLQPLENTGEIEVGYSLKPSYWRKGIGYEAASAWLRYGFEEAGLERIVAVCNEENVGSWRIMEKCGMTFEGIKEAYGMPLKWYSISKQEFLNRADSL